MNHVTAWLRLHILYPLVRLVQYSRHSRHRRLAVLIDGENITPDLIESILTEITPFGILKERRVYGNWSAPRMQHWREPCLRHGLRAMHTVPAKAGKNATDIALVVDTIELVQCGGLDGICLVASDSDYTPLVIRLRAAGLFVLGIGDSRSPDALVQACTVYRWLQQPGTPELPRADEPWALPKTHHGDQPTRTPASTANGTRPPTQARTDEPSALPSTPHGGEQARTPASTANGTRPQTHAVDNDPGPRLLKTWQAIAKEKGVVTLSLFVVRLQQEYPDFKPTSYGHKRLAALIRARTDLFSCTQGKQPNDINVERVPGQAPQNIRDLLVTAWQCAQKQDGWLYIATLGSQLRQIDPVFDVQQHGHKKLSELVHAHKNVFEIREGSKGQYYIRLRN